MLSLSFSTCFMYIYYKKLKVDYRVVYMRLGRDWWYAGWGDCGFPFMIMLRRWSLPKTNPVLSCTKYSARERQTVHRYDWLVRLTVVNLQSRSLNFDSVFHFAWDSTLVRVNCLESQEKEENRFWRHQRFPVVDVSDVDQTQQSVFKVRWLLLSLQYVKDIVSNKIWIIVGNDDIFIIWVWNDLTAIDRSLCVGPCPVYL